MRTSFQRLHTRPTGTSLRAFTLIETLVVIAILSALISLFLPAVGSVRAGVKSLKCSSNLRSVTMDFGLFVEGQADGRRLRGSSPYPNRLRISEFLDRLYKTNGYWDRGGLEQ